ncbi:tRNA (adenosine(37)-N6)-dimethylallyltransferase MiaA [Sulfurospirillum sp. 1612]|uniref:tRNA (adenosine(37)-N6)-dimethylallyltransferase MiaA n=1 Tax=Sulfurospirillum sp. 1612 TaxID=3094835 RepID=UPI002F945C53
MKILAILGPTASGKTALSLDLARKFNANILSLDSLSIYKEIDIASAKPTLEERGDIKHFGIDEIYPHENFNVSLYFDIYKKAQACSIKEHKDLIIVGGTGFYLKSLLCGLSEKPKLSPQNRAKVTQIMQNLSHAYDIMVQNDPKYAQKISPNDSYRIEKWLEIFIQSGLDASTYFSTHQQKPLINDTLPLFNIDVPRDYLATRVSKRTHEMVKQGLIDEVAYLEKRYTRAPNALKSIGIKETLAYLDGLYTKEELEEHITMNTLKLAKRQRTFNQTQFQNITKGSLEEIASKVAKEFLK